jgi:hypothetical protein
MEQSLERRLLLKCLAYSTALTLLIASLLLTRGLTVAFVLLFPAFWLTSTILGPNIATSDSGPENLIRMIFASCVLNIIAYTTIFFLIFRTRNLMQQRRLVK